MNAFTRFLKCRRQAGMSLIEVLVASLIIFFIFLSILPLFARAKASNRRGGESSLMTSFMVANLESINQNSINHNSFNDLFSTQEELEEEQEENTDEQGVDPLDFNSISLDDEFYFSNTTNYIGLSTQYYGSGSRDATTRADQYLGDETWLNRADAEDYSGQISWLKDVLLFNWDLSDINAGTISVAGTDEDGNPLPQTVVTVGHPRRFDNPLKWSQDNPPDIREVRVMVRSAVSASPIGTGPAMVLGYYRTF